MPDQFTRPNFNVHINQTMNFVKRLVSMEGPLDSDHLMDCLLPLEQNLIKYYQQKGQYSPQDARVNGQKTYRQFIQYVLCLACENNKNEQVCQ